MWHAYASSRRRSALRDAVQRHPIADAEQALAKDAHVHATPTGVLQLRDARGPLVVKGGHDRLARRGVRGHLDVDIAEGETRARLHLVPGNPGDRHVLTHRAPDDRMTLRRERVDPLLRVQTERAV